MPKVTLEYRAARRAEILRAARRCFIRKGFQETSMQDLLAEAETSSGALYNYFASKDEVIVAIAEENIGEVTDMLRRSTKASHPHGLGATVVELLALIRRMHRENGFAGMTVQVWSEALRNGALALQFQVLARDLSAYYGGLADQSTLPEGVTARALAETTAAVVSGFILQLALFGPDAAQDLPETILRLWPANQDAGEGGQ